MSLHQGSSAGGSAPLAGPFRALRLAQVWVPAHLPARPERASSILYSSLKGAPDRRGAALRRPPGSSAPAPP
jgi:hypothetical protein